MATTTPAAPATPAYSVAAYEAAERLSAALTRAGWRAQHVMPKHAGTRIEAALRCERLAVALPASVRDDDGKLQPTAGHVQPQVVPFQARQPLVLDRSSVAGCGRASAVSGVLSRPRGELNPASRKAGDVTSKAMTSSEAVPPLPFTKCCHALRHASAVRVHGSSIGNGAAARVEAHSRPGRTEDRSFGDMREELASTASDSSERASPVAELQKFTASFPTHSKDHAAAAWAAATELRHWHMKKRVLTALQTVAWHAHPPARVKCTNQRAVEVSMEKGVQTGMAASLGMRVSTKNNNTPQLPSPEASPPLQVRLPPAARPLRLIAELMQQGAGGGCTLVMASVEFASWRAYLQAHEHGRALIQSYAAQKRRWRTLRRAFGALVLHARTRRQPVLLSVEPAPTTPRRVFQQPSG